MTSTVLVLMVSDGCAPRSTIGECPEVLPYFAATSIEEDSMKLEKAYAAMGVVSKPNGQHKNVRSPYRVTGFVYRLERNGLVYFVDTSHQAALTRAMVDTLRSTAQPGDVLRLTDIICEHEKGKQCALTELRFALYR